MKPILSFHRTWVNIGVVCLPFVCFELFPSFVKSFEFSQFSTNQVKNGRRSPNGPERSFVQQVMQSLHCRQREIDQVLETLERRYIFPIFQRPCKTATSVQMSNSTALTMWFKWRKPSVVFQGSSSLAIDSLLYLIVVCVIL